VQYLFTGYFILKMNTYWQTLTWPFHLHQTISLKMLAPMAGVSLYVYWIRQRSPAQLTELAALENQLALKDQEYQKALHRVRTAENNLAAAEQRARQAEDRAHEAEIKAAGARAQTGGKANATGVDNRFEQVKRAFARKYHPDRVRVDGFDKTIRTEIFKEFWHEIERIEKG
jgi:hypothetical protein